MDNQNNQNVNQNVQNNQNVSSSFEVTRVNIPSEYEPISMWGYFGYELLFSIPCIGVIILIVFAFGGNKNINVRNFARSYFCWFIIAIVLALIVLLFTAILGIGFMSYRQ